MLSLHSSFDQLPFSGTVKHGLDYDLVYQFICIAISDVLIQEGVNGLLGPHMFQSCHPGLSVILFWPNKPQWSIVHATESDDDNMPGHIMFQLIFILILSYDEHEY